MDFDPRAYTDMFAPTTIQAPPQNQSYLMDSDTRRTGNGSKVKSNGRSRSSTNPMPTTESPETVSALTRTISSPTPSTTPKVQPKPRRGLFSLLASAAQQPTTPPKSTPPRAEPETAATPNGAPEIPVPQPTPSFIQNFTRRFSASSNKRQITDTKNQAPQCPRRTLNVNHQRPRPEIKELEKIHLKRVCFIMDETLVSRRLFKASEPFETELPREQKLRVRDLKEAYYRSSKNREVTPDDRVAKAFAQAKGIELRKLDLSLIKFGSKESVLPICDVLSLASGLEEMVLDHCELTNEQLRLFLAALLCLKARSEQELDHCRGISKLSLVGNESLGIDGWKSLACFVHMNANLISLNISQIPLSTEAATVLARAIALPNPSRREIPPEFRLQPISPRPKQRKFSFRRGSSGSLGPELAKPTSPTAKRQPTVVEEIEAIPENPVPEVKQETKTMELPSILVHSPLTMTSAESSSIVIVEPGEGMPPTPTGWQTENKATITPPRRKIEDLRMNQCDVTAEILETFLPAITTGGVKFWDIGGNKLGLEGMTMLANLFTDAKLEKEKEKEKEESGRTSPAPSASMSSVTLSTTSIPLEETREQPANTTLKLEYLSLKGTDLSSGHFDPILEVWLQRSVPANLCLWALDLRNCRLGRQAKFMTDLLAALARFPNFRVLVLQQNSLFANPKMSGILRDGLPRLHILRRLDLSSTGMEAQHLVELARVLPDVKVLAALDISDNPIYVMNDVEEEQEGQTEDVSGLTALEAAMRYCRQIIEVEIPEGGGVEGARLRHKIFLRCFKNIELLDYAAHPHATADPSDPAVSRKRATTEDAKDLSYALSKEGRDKFKVDRGHGVARALETVLNAQREDKAQDLSLDLLHRARKIKERLQPALSKPNQDPITSRRLFFLNQVLSKVIDRFEEAYPECRNIPPNPKPDHEPASSDEEDLNDDEEKEEEEISSPPSSPPSPSRLRRSSSLTEIARGLELEEGDVHRFGSLIRKRNITGAANELTGEQLLEAILKVDKETIEREVWDKDGLRKVLRKSIDASAMSGPVAPMVQKTEDTVAEDNSEGIVLRGKKKDSDSHSI